MSRGCLALVAAFLVAAGALFPSAPALAAAPSQVAALTITGHGWGHGRGLGQWGAFGYSLPPFNWSAGQILNHFYAGTAGADIGNPALEVVLNGPGSSSAAGISGPAIAFLQRGTPQVSAQFGTPWSAPAPAVHVTRTGVGRFDVRYGSSCSGPWGSPQSVTAAFVRILPAAGNPGTIDDALQVCDGAMSGGSPDDRRWLRGELWTRATSSRQYTTNVLSVEEYLPGVVPFEMPASWPAAALQAQAVAARSYAVADAAGRASAYGFAGTCDTISCQVYAGRQRRWSGAVRTEDPRANAAIAATVGHVRVPAGWVPGQPPARTEFSSSTGGWTAGGAFAAVEDLGDGNAPGNPHHTWVISMPAGQIEAAYGQPAGSFRGARVLQRNGLGEWGGRALLVDIHFTTGNRVVSGDDVRVRLGLRSNWFAFNADPWASAGGVGPSAVSWAPGRYDVVAAGTDAGLWHQAWDGTRWVGWQPIGGRLTSAPGASTYGPGRLDVAARGGDGSVWHTYFDAGRWVGWESLGGAALGAPAAASWAPGRYDVFAAGTDAGLWHQAWDGTRWLGWEPIGGRLTSSPGVSTWGPGRLDVVARGGDGAVWHNAFEGGRWLGWESLGGITIDAPSGVSWAPGHYDVFATGADNALWHRAWSGTAWLPWEPVGGRLTSGPSVSSFGPGRLDVAARGGDGAIWHNFSEGGRWFGWESLGGVTPATL